MKRITKKVRSNKGESLIESMVSILIFTFASIMLYTMLTTSTELNKAARDADEKHSLEMLYAEQADGAYPELEEGKDGTGHVEISLVGEDGRTDMLVKYKVDLHRLDDDSLYSYEKSN